MLNFAAITPHPPIIVPGIGKPEDLEKAKQTIEAMEKLSKEIAEADIDTIIIISPHALVHTDRMAVYTNPRFKGDFKQFGAKGITFEFDNNLELAEKIIEKSNEAGVKAYGFGDPENDYFDLDHGEMVPLYYLRKNLPESVRIIPIAYSYLDRLQHFAFGEILNEAVNAPEFADSRIAIIASGDLSHRLIAGAPAGFSKAGKEFDQEIVEYLKNNKVQEILEMDEEFIESAGECGYRSILILLGALDGLKYKPEILSYEGPFGVGYLVANFVLTS